MNNRDLIKQWQSKWNSFNGAKALVHVNHWKKVQDGDIPPPIMVSIDPSSICNLSCPHCNAAEVLRNKNTVMTKDVMNTIIDRLLKWKTRAVCIGGGGESLTNNNTYYLIDKLYETDVETALITSGVLLNKNYETLMKLNYIGISVDAATNKTWQEIKGTTKYDINDVFKNMKNITGKGLEVTYKFLLLPNNYNEVYEACKIAKNLGCDQFHVRPGSYPWFEEGKSYEYTEEARLNVADQLDNARRDFEDKNFRIYGIVSNFSTEWKVQKTFKKCWACYTTCVIAADGMVSLCCDRRGDKKLELGYIFTMDTTWGSTKHKGIHNSINVHTCPRCTYSHVNEIFEQVIMKDEMRYNFF